MVYLLWQEGQKVTGYLSDEQKAHHAKEMEKFR